MDDNTKAIVRLAWSRVLSLPEGDFGSGQARTVREAPGTIMFVRLWDSHVLVAPAWFLARAVTCSDAELANGSHLLALSADHGGRLVGRATLAFLDDYVAHDDPESTPITDDRAAVADLERACPPDDVAEVGLAELEPVVVTLDERNQPTAGAGYVEWEHIVAHLGVLTAPEFRRRGLGFAAAALAVNHALDAGLVPQWRARSDNSASRRLARRLGFVEVGSQTTVMLPS